MVGVSNKCTEDIARERRKCSFSTTELTHFWDGGAEHTERRKQFGLSTLLPIQSRSINVHMISVSYSMLFVCRELFYIRSRTEGPCTDRIFES